MAEKMSLKSISLLKNAIHYLFNWAIIIKESNQRYRLLVASSTGELLADEYRKTFRGARATFSRRFSNRSRKKDAKPQWTAFYQPDTHWLQHKLSFAALHKHIQALCHTPNRSKVPGINGKDPRWPVSIKKLVLELR